jgi:hypothetical protein
MSANTLARLWKSRGFAPDRLLFITYVLNFRDFHDQVLRRLLDSARGRRLSVDVVTSCVDVEEESDCFDYRYLAPLGNRFRLFRCDSVPLAHAKAIVAQDSLTGRWMSGFGSANLTPAGWRRNLEVWRWDDGRSVPAILNLCDTIKRRNGLRPALETEWLTPFGARRHDPSIVLLGTSQSPSFETILERMTRSLDRPKVVRVASPYFDAGSGELFDRIGRKLAGCRLEIWSDRSGKLAEPTHWRTLSGLLPELRRAFQGVMVLAPPPELPWHAKVFELEDARGRVARVFGSANFTGAAWGLKRPGNLEIAAVDIGSTGLHDLLAARDIKVTPVTEKERTSLARREEHEQIARCRGPVLLWACLNEIRPAQITARLARPEHITRWLVEGAFDETRPEDERDELRKIRDRLQNRARWQLRQSGREIILAWRDGGEFIPCERMTLRVRTSSGTCSAPIWIPEPDWSTRDQKTGMPIARDQWSIEALLRGQRPIVGLRRKDRDPEQDEELAEELNLAADVDIPMDHPDYEHEPEVMMLARYLRDSVNTGETMRRRLQAIARRGSPKDRLLADAVLAVRKQQ